MLVVKRRQIVILVLIVMIIVAGYLNWSYKRNMEYLPTGTDIDETEDTAQKNLGEAQLVDNTVDTEESETSLPEDSSNIVVDTGSSNKYFIEARMNRERSRSEALEILYDIINNENSPEESKIKAQEEAMKVAKIMDTETMIENLLMAKGFEDAVVFINEGKVNVVVQSEGLIPSQVAQIKDAVITHTGVTPEDIKIVEIK
ncbi:MAG: SpoIIIAH-like family protein [Clostridiaceae bacterium]|nr:SpoIIIAH-like family protein [Clostridiaceae bacterium]